VRLPPFCRRKVRLSQKTATKAENGEKTAAIAEFGDSRTFLRQSPFFATVAVFGDKLTVAEIGDNVDRLLMF